MLFNEEHLVNKNQISSKKTNKSQILLLNSCSNIKEHLNKLSCRYNNKYPYIPTFTIDKNGVIYKHFDPEFFSIIFNNVFDEKIISVALENVGWLIKDEKGFIDWSGNIYNGEVETKLWRNKHYWAKYANKQVSSLIYLLEFLTKEYGVEPVFSGKILPISKPSEFRGILNRSNYSKYYYDLSPAFEFTAINEKFGKYE